VPKSVTSKLLLALALTAFLFMVVRPLLRLAVDRWYRPGAGLSPELFAILLIGVFLCAAAADRIGVQALTGGFLFGACVPQVEGLAAAMAERLHELVVILLIPVLLAVSGLQANMRVFELDDIPGLLLFLVAMVASKWRPTLAAGRAVGMRWDESNAVGVLMNCRGLEILIVGLIGKQAGVLTSGMLIVFVLGAIVTTLMTGPLFDRFAPKEPTVPMPADVIEAELATSQE
jgi:Kef-type K+ transport system membrane component KefB